MMRQLWWGILTGCILLTVAGVALRIEQLDQVDFETRGHEQATTQHDMPARPLQLAGINVELTQYDDETLPAELNAIAEAGFTWVRQSFYWERIEPTEGEFDWSTYDAIVEAVTEAPGLHIIAVLDGTPAWARDRLAPEHPFAPPASAAQFATFARAVAERYGDTIDYYQIWDEPNLRSHWGNTDPRPAIYTAMLKASYPAIHSADDTAEVIMAALAPTVEQGPANYNEISYLNAIYTHGGQNFFDAAAARPYGYNTGPDDRMVDGSTFNFSRVILMREAMVAQGDADKAIWGSNFGWNTLPSDWQGPPSIWGQVNADEQIQFTHDAFVRARDEWPWMAGLILQHWEPDAPADDPIQGFTVKAIASDNTLVPVDNGLLPGFYETDPENPFVSFDGEWQFGPLGADALPVDADDPDAVNLENRATITFHGTDFALLVRRYDVITGHYIVQIDGQNANALPENRQGEAHIVLKATDDGESLDLIEVATGLENTTHTATLIHRPRQGDDAWAFAGIAVSVAPESTENNTLNLLTMGLIGFGIIGTLISMWRVPWGSVQLPSQQTLQNAADASLTLLLSFVFMVSSALTWGEAFSSFLRRDPPAILLTLATVGVAFVSPIAVLSVVALLAFAVVVFNRPLMGVIATLFWSMFFSSTVDAYVRLIAAVEAMLIISLIAALGRGIYEWAKTWRQSDRRMIRVLLQLNDEAQKLHALDVGIGLMVSLAIMSITYADLRPEAIHELRVMILGPALFYVLLRTVPLAQRDLSLIIDTIIIGGTIIACLGLYNFVTGDAVTTADGSRRLVAVYGSPNAVALQLGRCLPFALAYVLMPLSSWRRILGALTTSIMAIAYLLTQSLGGIVIGAPLAVVVYLVIWQGQRAWRLVAGFAAIGALAIVPLTQLIPRLRNLNDLESGSTLFRINVWRSTLELLEDYPLTGVGLDQFLYVYRSRYIMPEGAADPNLSHPHNILFEHWVRFGILGVLVMVYIQVMFWRLIMQLYTPVRQSPLLFAAYLGTGGAMAYVLAHGIVDASLVFINLSYMYVTIIGILLLVRRFNSEAV